MKVFCSDIDNTWYTIDIFSTHTIAAVYKITVSYLPQKRRIGYVVYVLMAINKTAMITHPSGSYDNKISEVIILPKVRYPKAAVPV